MNSITDLLDLEDSNIYISDVRIEGTRKILTLETAVTVHFCPICGYRMHSRGIKTKTINHPVLQDTYELVLKLKQRRWRCTNEQCAYTANESFNFVNKRRRNTNATDMLIINAFRDLSASASGIAARFNMSDSSALEIFDRYVKMDRLPLSDILSIDEVCLDLDPHCRYALVLQDFYTGNPIDLLSSRRSHDAESFFVSIPLSERAGVKYLISDMYNPYISWCRQYFPNATPVVDSFHVIQWIIRKLENYIRDLIKKFRKRDRDIYISNGGQIDEHTRIPLSREVYLLQKYRWIILANQNSITYHSDLRMDPHLHCMMNTFDYEDSLFSIDPQLRKLRDLKELYVQFNTLNAGKPMDARIELDQLIDRYLHCDSIIFNDFANLLIRYHDYIINSFVMVEKHGSGKIYSSRLSNGPIESLNRKAKDLKRLGRGYRNFEHFRNRFLYATRENPVINGSSSHSTVTQYKY
jgi:transposase